MTDPNTNCPFGWLNSYSKRTCGRINRNSYSCDSAFSPVIGWQLTSHSKRSCGRLSTTSLSCDSVLFSVSGGDYTSVCGSIRAYQKNQTDAFETFIERRLLEPMFLVSVSHMAIHDNTSGHLLLLLLRAVLMMRDVPALVPHLWPPCHLLVKIISVIQESTLRIHVASIQMILSGMAKVAVAVAVARSTIFHTSLRHSPAPPLTL